MEAGLMRINSTGAIYGERYFSETFPPNFAGFFAAVDKDTRNALADRCRGPFVSQRGSFTFEKDEAHKWLTDVDLSFGETAKQVDEVRRAANMLGSISLDAFAIFYSNGVFTGFWIEASEGDKKRIVASDIEDGAFVALPQAFQFSAPWLAKVIAAYF